jgi:hypothetical protein
MTNVSTTSGKVATRGKLFQAALQALKDEGWTIERIAGSGKSSVRRITNGKLTEIVSIRTTQDRWIAFPRTPDDNAWATLQDVDCVVASSVDDYDNPRFAQVHKIPGDEMRRRFDKAYAARKKANHVVPVGRGVWLSLYEKEATEPVSYVGGGIGLAYPAIARVPLSDMSGDSTSKATGEDLRDDGTAEAPLTIAEAKRRLARSLGVNESDIKITIST